MRITSDTQVKTVLNRVKASNNVKYVSVLVHLVHGSVYVWGYSKACGFKTDVLSPTCVYSCSEESSIVDMAGGDSHSMILTSSGIVYSWGNNFEVRKM